MLLEDLDKEMVYYLAQPYSDTDSATMEWRYEIGNAVAAKLIKHDIILIEPIATCHSKAEKYGLPRGYEFWKRRDRKLIEKCDMVLVLTLPGWTNSKGVCDETSYAEHLGKPVRLVGLEDVLSW